MVLRIFELQEYRGLIRLHGWGFLETLLRRLMLPSISKRLQLFIAFGVMYVVPKGRRGLHSVSKLLFVAGTGILDWYRCSNA